MEKNKEVDVREKLKDIIIEWANGKDIQFRGNDKQEWMDINGTPVWDSTCEYRVKPVVTKRYIGLSVDRDGDIVYNNDVFNVEVEIEDGEIKSISLLKEPFKNPSPNKFVMKKFDFPEVKVSTTGNDSVKDSMDAFAKAIKELRKNTYFSPRYIDPNFML